MAIGLNALGMLDAVLKRAVLFGTGGLSGPLLDVERLNGGVALILGCLFGVVPLDLQVTDGLGGRVLDGLLLGGEPGDDVVMP